MNGLNFSLGFGREITKHFYGLIEVFYIDGNGSSFGIIETGRPRSGFGEVGNKAYGINFIFGISGY
jgi:hypothetical protein